jgi:oligopeptide transport system permease protein
MEQDMENRMPESLGMQAMRRLFRNRMALVSLAFVVFIGAICAIGPWFLSHDYETQNRALGPAGPSAMHWLGTDVLGRDQLARIFQGGQISLKVGLIATAVSIFIGVFYGLASGFWGGRMDSVMMRLVDVLYSLPFTLFVILMTVIFGQEMGLIYLAIGAVSWLTMARIVRNQVLALKAQPFVEAAFCLGQSHWRIMTRHLLPNLVGTVVVYATLTVPSVMLVEAFVSFLGLGVKAPMTSWGLLIKEGADAMEEYPWLLIFPSLFFSTTLFALNFLGDGLRDAFDPRASKEI